MTHIRSVTSASAQRIHLPAPLNEVIVVVAQGEVPTTGWTHIRLTPRYYVVPPADGIWDFDLIGDEPHGIVGQIVLPVAAETIEPHLRWCTGVRVHSASNSIVAQLTSLSNISLAPTATHAALAAGHVIYRHIIASFDDSFQPTGRTKFDPWPHAQMKKLHHELELIVEGPDEQRIRDCVGKAAAAGLIAAIVAAFVTAGAALPAAISAFLGALEGCLGRSFTARIDNHSHWEYWWT